MKNQKLTVLSNSTDAPPNVGTSYLCAPYRVIHVLKRYSAANNSNWQIAA